MHKGAAVQTVNVRATFTASKRMALVSFALSGVCFTHGVYKNCACLNLMLLIARRWQHAACVLVTASSQIRQCQLGQHNFRVLELLIVALEQAAVSCMAKVIKRSECSECLGSNV
jgi:hypothetical protein